MLLKNYNIFSSLLPFKLPPSFWCCLSVIAGIVATSNYIFIISLIVVIISFTAGTYKGYTSPHTTLLCVLFFVGGSYVCKEKLTIQSIMLRDVYISGTIVNKTFINNPRWCYRTKIKIKKIKTSSGWIENNFECYIYTQKRFYPRVRDTVKCGPLTIKSPTENGFHMYLAREGVATTSFAQDLPYTIVNRPKKSYLNWLFWQRELLQIKLRKKCLEKHLLSFLLSLLETNSL